MAEVNLIVKANSEDASKQLEEFGKDGERAFKRLQKAAKDAGKPLRSWNEIHAKMAPLTKEVAKGLGATAKKGEAQKIAMSKLSAEWREYKRSIVNADRAGKKSIDTTNKQTSALGRLKLKAMGVIRTMSSLKGLLIAYGAIRFGRVFLGSIAAIETGWVQVIKRTGLAGEELKTFQSKIRNLSTELKGIKLGELQEVAAVGGQLGIATKDLVEFTRVITMTGVATKLTSEQAAIGLAKVTNVLSEPISKLEDIASVMNDLSNNSTALSSELVDFVKVTGTVSKTIGLTTPEVFALGATLKDMGVQTEVAGTAILNLFTKLFTDTENIARVAGVSTQEFTRLLTTDPIKAVQKLSFALREMNTFDAIRALDELGLRGKRVLQTMLGLARGTQKLNVHLARANREYKNGTSLLIEYTSASKSLISEATSTGNAFRILAEQIGVAILPVLKEVLPLVSQIVLGYAKAVETFVKSDAFEAKLKSFITAVKTLVSVFGWLIGATTRVIVAFVSLRVEIFNVEARFIKMSVRIAESFTKLSKGFIKAVLGMDTGAKAIPRTLENINKEIDILRRSIDGLSKSPGEGASEAVIRLTGFLEVALKKQKELMDEASGRNGKSAGESLAKGLEGPAIEVAVKNTSDFVEGAFDNIDLSLNNTAFSKFNQTIKDMEDAATAGVENINISFSAIGALSLPVVEDVGLSLDNTALIVFQQSVLDIKADFFDQTISLIQLTADREVEIQAEKNEKIKENERKVKDFRIFALRATGSALANIELALSIAANDRAGAAFEAMKAVSIAIAIVKTIESAISAFAAGNKIGGPPLGFAFAATAVAAGIAMVAQIASTQPGSQSVGGVGGGSEGGSAPPAGTPGVDTTPPDGTPPIINMVTNIFNPLGDEDWDRIAEDNINPAMSRLFDRDIVIAGS